MDDALQKFLTKDSSHTAAEAVEPKTAAISVATHLGYYRSNNEDNYYADELGISPVENSNKACKNRSCMLRFPQLKYTQMSIIFLRPEKFGITGLFGLFVI